MTYAELLADNQRLRKRIIELEQENAKSSVVLSCQYFGKIYRTKKLNNGSRVTGSAI